MGPGAFYDDTAGLHYGHKDFVAFHAWVVPTMFGARLVIGQPGQGTLDDAWCYESPEAGVRALEEWDGEGEPQGWHRHPWTSRRRPGGDATREYIRE